MKKIKKEKNVKKYHVFHIFFIVFPYLPSQYAEKVLQPGMISLNPSQYSVTVHLELIPRIRRRLRGCDNVVMALITRILLCMGLWEFYHVAWEKTPCRFATVLLA